MAGDTIGIEPEPSQQLHLTHAEAAQRISQVDDAMATIEKLANKILDNTHTMTAGSWLGGRAQTFSRNMAQHHDDLNAVINALRQVAEKGKSDITTLVSHDTA